MLRLVLVVALAAAGCVIPLGAPPSRMELGYGGRSRLGGAQRFAVGASLGSLVPAAEAPVELGGGLLVDLAPPVDEMGVSAGSAEANVGGYVDLGYAVRRSAHTRLLVGGRYERFKAGPIAHAANLRVDAELVGHTEGSSAGADGCAMGTGGWYGNGGLGAFAQVGPTWLTDDTRGWAATIGVSVRLPAWGGVVVGLPCGKGGGGGSSGSSGRRGLGLSGG